MNNKDLFKQAIAEAKTIREAAITNAKEALEESLTPHLKEMLAQKLQEMEDKEGVEEGTREGVYNDFTKWKESFPEGTEFKSENGYMVARDEDGKELGKWNPTSIKGMHADDFQYKNLEEAEEEDAPEEEEEEPTEEDEELDLENMTKEEFTDLVLSIVAQEKGDEEAPEGEEDMPVDDMTRDRKSNV